MKSVRWHPIAREEFLSAARYYGEQLPCLDDEFMVTVRHAINLLREFPYLGQEAGPDYRRMVLHRFPYGIIYRVRQRELQIKGIIHHRLSSGQWVGR